MKYSCDGQDGHLWIFCLRSTFDIVHIGEPVFNPASCSVNTLWYLWQIYFKDFKNLKVLKMFSEEWQLDN